MRKLTVVAVGALALLAGCGLSEGECYQDITYNYDWSDDYVCKGYDGKTFRTDEETASNLMFGDDPGPPGEAPDGGP